MSRVGAVAWLVDGEARTGVPTRRLGALVTVVASIIISIGVTLTIRADLGAGPLDVFHLGLAGHGVPIVVSVWGIAATFVAIAVALGHRPGPGTLLSPLVTGPVLGRLLAATEAWAAPGPIVAAAMLLAGIGLVGLGAGGLVASRFGAGTGELLATAAATRAGARTEVIRTAIELTILAIGVALGGPIGVGTVVIAVLVGPAVALGHRIAAATLPSGRDPATVSAHVASQERVDPLPVQL